MGMDKLKPPAGAFATKQAMVHETLCAAIMDGALAAGERVVIDEVARRLNVSIIPVREALHQLQSEGLVEMRPHVGPVVTGFDDTAVAEIFTLLECLEVAAARHAVTRAAETDLRELDRLVAQMDKADGDRWEDLNARFHAAMCAAARMPRVAEAFTRVATDWARLYRTRLRSAVAIDHSRAQDEHRAMLTALRGHDLAALETVIAAHNRRAIDHYRSNA
jgi:DNA-binding GntR family transcriptional regulator